MRHAREQQDNQAGDKLLRPSGRHPGRHANGVHALGGGELHSRDDGTVHGMGTAAPRRKRTRSNRKDAHPRHEGGQSLWRLRQQLCAVAKRLGRKQ